MIANRFRPVLCILLILIVGSFALAQTADEVIEKYLAASGGRDALSKMQSRIMKGTFAMPDMGMYAPMEMYTQSPDKSFSYIEIAGMGSASNGVNGEVAWEINPMVGARILLGPERGAALLQARIEPMLDWKKLYSSAELAGEDTVNGKKVWKLVLTSNEGAVTTHFMDQETGLVTKVETVREGQTMSTTLSDYREVDGIKIPHKVNMSSPQFAFEITIDSVQHNVPIPPEKFELPAEIKAQLP